MSATDDAAIVAAGQASPPTAEFNGTVALVTGGSQGIGRAVAELLAAEASRSCCPTDCGPRH